MKIKYSIGILCFTLFGLGACLDDQSSLGNRELSEITISAPHDTLTAYFGEEFVVRNSPGKNYLSLMNGVTER